MVRTQFTFIISSQVTTYTNKSEHSIHNMNYKKYIAYNRNRHKLETLYIFNFMRHNIFFYRLLPQKYT